MKIAMEELQYNKNGKKYENGYRIVYFYNDHYFIGEFCKTIEGFIIGFTKCNPIIDESDIPPFVSIDDSLNRYLNEVKDASAIAIYKTNGTCVAIKKRN